MVGLVIWLALCHWTIRGYDSSKSLKYACEFGLDSLGSYPHPKESKFYDVVASSPWAPEWDTWSRQASDRRLIAGPSWLSLKQNCPRQPADLWLRGGSACCWKSVSLEVRLLCSINYNHSCLIYHSARRTSYGLKTMTHCKHLSQW